jgi:hypothetical protein
MHSIADERAKLMTRGELGKMPARIRLGPAASIACAIVAIAWAAIAACGCATIVPSGCANDSVPGSEPFVRLADNHVTNFDLTKDKSADESKTLGLEMDFALRHQAEFDHLMDQINDHSSPMYHHWLTPARMHARFGESRAEFDALRQWLIAQGFTITDQTYGTNADFIKFKGTIGQIEKAFHVCIVSPEYDTYANENDPAIPARFNGVVSHIIGLDNVGAL